MRLLSLSQKNLSKEEYLALDPTVVRQVKPFDIPCGFKQIFNPTWTFFEGALITAVRCGNYAATPLSSFVGIVPIDSSTYEALETPTWMDIKEVLPEDPRLIVIDGRLWLFFNARAKSSFVKIFLCPLEKRMGRWEIAKAPVELTYADGPQGRIEKNWMPVVHNNELYLIYSLTPYTLLKADLKTGLCKRVDVPPVHFPWAFGEPRGSTQLVPHENGYLGTFHSSKKTDPRAFRPRTKVYYFLGGFSLDENLHLNGVSKNPFDLPGFYNRGGNGKVIFPSGLIDRGDELVLCGGKNDQSSLIITLDKKALIDGLEATSINAHTS